MPKNATITVTANDIVVEPEPIDLQGEGQAAVVIQWDIATPGWSFTTPGGIGINNAKFDDNGSPPGNRRRYTWTRKANNADGSTVKYSISVTDGTGPPRVKDPTIINRP